LGLWYDVFTKLAQFVEIFILVFLQLYLMAEYKIILELSVVVLVVALAGDVLEIFLAVVANLFKKST